MKNLRKIYHISLILQNSGNWLCSEDKELYRNQVESGGRVGYTTKKVASISTKHLSNRPKSSSEPSTNQVQDFSRSTNTEEDKSSTDSYVAEESSTIYMVKGMIFISTLYRGFIQSAAYCCLQIELS